ncbi:MAG: histidinol-phosphate transaminase [Clostridiales bacterium]|nr:histidinol-phosphate transaminase [Candidatus Crickella merdequi]
MSRFFSSKYSNLVPYTPGEQPKDMKYIKLNTNESPFPPSEKAIAAALEEAKKLQLYSDPDCTDLVKEFCEVFGVEKDEVLFTNGSDEILNFAFMAFCDDDTPAIFPETTYGFYPVFAELNHVPYKEIPLREDFTINIEDYFNAGGTVFIANPNAPTGIALTPAEVRAIVENNPDNIVVIDEAYVDFGTESSVPLVKEYDNLVVTQTFSKSRSLAGARLGFGIAKKELIQDMNTIKYSTNPYNVNRMSMAAGLGCLKDEEYTKANCQSIIESRAFAMEELRKLGFEMTDSKANFIFVKHPEYSGAKLQAELKKKGILIRHFSKPALDEYNRITIGTKEQMQALIDAVAELLGR